MNTRVSFAIVVGANLLLSSCKTQPSSPSSGSGVFDTIQAASLHDGFGYLTGKPTLRVDTFSDGLSVSRTYYVCRTWVGTNFGDTGTARLTDIPIPVVTIP